MFPVPRYLGTDQVAALSAHEKDALERLHRLARKRSIERRSRDKKDGASGLVSAQVSAHKRSDGASCRTNRSSSEEIGGDIAFATYTSVSDGSVSHVDQANSSEEKKEEEEEVVEEEVEEEDEEKEVEEEEEEENEEVGGEEVGGEEVEEEEEKEVEEEEEEEEGGEEEIGDGSAGSVDQSVEEPFGVLGHDKVQPRGRGHVGVAAVPKWMEQPVPVSEDFAGQSMPLDQFPLPNTIIENLHKMGVKSFFPVQCVVVPRILECSSGLLLRPASGVRPRDMCVSSPTGSGKTLAYVVPIVTVLSQFSDHALRCVVVVPSQDLVEQVGGVFEQVGTGTGLRVFRASGKRPLMRERGHLVDSAHCGRSCIDVLLTTPGHLVDYLGLGLPLPLLRYLVVDEVDRLIDQSFQEWLDRILAAVGPGNSQLGVGPGTSQMGVGPGTSQVGVGPSQMGVVDGPSTLLRRMLEPLVGTSLFFSGAGLPSHRPSSSVARAPRAGQETAEGLLGSEVPLQKLLFSATLTQSPEKLALLRLYRPLLFSSLGATSDMSPSRGTWHSLPASLQEFGIVTLSQDKPLMVLHLLVNVKLQGMLCFARSRQSVHRLCRLIQHFGGVACGEFSSDCTPGQRQESLTAFESGQLDVLVCSDAMARGMDLGRVSVQGGGG